VCLIDLVYFADNPVASGTERGSGGVKQSRTPVKAQALNKSAKTCKQTLKYHEVLIQQHLRKDILFVVIIAFRFFI